MLRTYSSLSYSRGLRSSSCRTDRSCISNDLSLFFFFCLLASVKMSSYLLAIVVSQYGYIESRTNRGTPVSDSPS